MDRQKIEAALDEGTLAIRVGRSWVPAVRSAETFEHDGNWIIFVRGGPAQRRGIITNIDNNAGGREFAFVGERAVA